MGEKKTFLVIGGGAGGYAAALLAAKEGCQVTLIEKEKVGGECVHKGCIPTKKYLRAASVWAEVNQQERIFGGKISSVDNKRLWEETEQIIAKSAYGIRYRLKNSEVRLLKGEAQIIGRGRVLYLPENNQEKVVIEADGICIATGSQAQKIELPGDCRSFSEDELFTVKPEELSSKIYVLGAGATGVETAVIFSMLGKEVNLAEQAASILPGMDEEISERLEVYLRELGIAVKTEVKPGEQGETFTDGDVFVCCGRTPVVPMTENISLAKNDKGGIITDKHQETSCKGIYAVGDCTGVRMEANIARMQAVCAVNHFVGKQDKEYRRWELRNIPHCVYTPIEALCAGITEQETAWWEERTGEKLQKAETELSVLGAGMIMGENEGFLKVLYDWDSGKIRGVHLLSKEAAASAPFVQLILQKEMTLDEIKELPYLHPAIAEAFGEL